MGGNLDGVRDRGQRAQRGRPRPRPPGRQPRGLPEPDPARPDAECRPLLRGLSRRAGRHPRLGPPPPRDPRPPDPGGQADPRLLAGAPAQPRRDRDGPDRARPRRRDPRARAVAVHGHQLVVAAPARHADAPRHPRDVGPQPGHRDDPVHARGRDGAGDARGRARRAERRGARRDRPDPGGPAGLAGGLRRLHLERRHAVGRARLRDAGVHADRADRRPAGPPLRRAVPLVERVGGATRSTPRPPTSRCSRCGARSWAGSTC